MMAHVAFDRKYQGLYGYLNMKCQEWESQTNDYASRHVMQKGKHELAQEFVRDARFAETKIYSIVTSPTADDVLTVVNAIASPYDFTWVAAADILKDAILIAAGKKQRNSRMIASGLVGAFVLLLGLLDNGGEE